MTIKTILNFTHKSIVFIINLVIDFYKRLISPYLPNACRFEPTCSVYMKEAIRIHGILKGTYLGVKRILRCHPWGKAGFDPVPQKPTNTNKKAN